MTTVVSTPTTVANGSAKNGDLPNIKPLKVNGVESTPEEKTPIPATEEKEEKLTNGNHEEKEEEKAPVAENGEVKSADETEATNEISNGKSNLGENVVVAQEAEPTSA